MNALKWYMLSLCAGTAQVFRPDDGGGGSEAPSGASAPAGGGDGGGTSSPTPSAPPSSAPGSESEALGAGAPDWSNLGSVDDLDYHVEVAAEPKPPTPPEPPKEPVPQPVQPAKPAPAPPQDPTPPPATATAQPSEGAGRSPPLSAADPWRIAEGLEANREAVIAHLASAKFALSEDDIKDLDTDVTVAVPKLLARVFLESQVSMQKFLAQAVPGMVKQYNTVTSANKSAEDAFFSAHKALDVNNPQHRATAVRIATVYRQANPDIPLNQLIAEVGPMVMAALRVNASAQPAQLVQPGARAAAAGRMPAGFVPAVNGGGGVSPTPDTGNPWDGLGRNFDDY